MGRSSPRGSLDDADVTGESSAGGVAASRFLGVAARSKIPAVRGSGTMRASRRRRSY